MDDVALADYVIGLNYGPVEVWRTDRCVSQILEVKTSSPAWLSGYTLTKNGLYHKDISFQDYQLLPKILSAGLVIRGRKRRIVEVLFADPDISTTHGFAAYLKSTVNGEVFVTSFHRKHMSEIRRLYRRAIREGMLHRPPDSKLARMLPHRARAT